MPLISARVVIAGENPELSNREVVIAKEFTSSSHAPHTTIDIPLQTHGRSSALARSPKKCCMKATTEAETAVMKDGDALDATKAAESLHLLAEAVAPQKALLLAVKTVCCAYNEDF